jgi:chemotaxis protein methyltransferase CheR
MSTPDMEEEKTVEADEEKTGTAREADLRQSERIELDLLLEAIFRKYGYDFRNYARASLKRRVARRMVLEHISSLSVLQGRLLYDKTLFETLLLDLSINVTEMFRDPLFFKALRHEVLPTLRDLSFIKIWHAGCSTGEEVYSMAILLTEEGLYEKTRIYATDVNEKVLLAAKEGIYPMKAIEASGKNYLQSGGQHRFSDYYTAGYDHAILNRELKKNIVFSDHNLAQDSSFGEMDIIICRNVLIYFDKKLQNRALSLFSESLVPDGFLCLGSKESIRFADCASQFRDVAAEHRIYRKK